MSSVSIDPTQPINTHAIISFVAGILGWTLLPLIGTVVAICYGRAALTEIRASHGAMQGEKLARIGLWLGWAHVAVLALVLIAAPIMTRPITVQLPGTAALQTFSHAVNSPGAQA